MLNVFRSRSMTVVCRHGLNCPVRNLHQRGVAVSATSDERDSAALAAPHIRVLSIDGGGVRGIIPAKILSRLEQHIQALAPDTAITDHVDVIAGTSIGGIIATMLCAPRRTDTPTCTRRPMFTAASIIDFLEESAGVIFPQSSPWDPVRQLFQRKHSHQPIEALLRRHLSDLTTGDYLRQVVIPAYDITMRAPCFFTKRKHQGPDLNFYMRDVCRGTAAAPTFFEPAMFSSVDGSSQRSVIDGGVFCNNPTIAAVSFVLDRAHRNRHTAHGPEAFDSAAVLGSTTEKGSLVSLNEMMVLSLGTGDHSCGYSGREASRWGAAEWLKPALSMMMSGHSETIDYQTSILLSSLNRRSNYLRVQIHGDALSRAGQPELISALDKMDDPSHMNISALKRIGDIALQMPNQQRDTWGRRCDTSVTVDDSLAKMAERWVAETNRRRGGNVQSTNADTMVTFLEA